MSVMHNLGVECSWLKTSETRTKKHRLLFAKKSLIPMASSGEISTETPPHYDRLQELKAFDSSKAGVKGIVDAGISRIPRMFVRPSDELASDYPICDTQIAIPVIDLAGRRSNLVEEVWRASETLGFFQVVNHGIPNWLLEEVMRKVRGFHELPREVKETYYTRDPEKKVKFRSNFDLYETRSANWRDTLFCVMGPKPLDPLELPEVCRETIIEYSKQITGLGITLFGLLSEALGLQPDHLIGMDGAKGHAILGHYYPACPEPDLTMGTSKHSDPDFLTILLQDKIGGLQVLHQKQWINVPPVSGALVVNIGDLLQVFC
ncbi:unnamed protein product [Ilex paraguariensis]|uniref:Fe2OG dioxygenase domain-containing protein n=1 Tax=Ilex paraguariensis TaxID=185542 RepID=A0ABC8SSE3_9AQUA